MKKVCKKDKIFYEGDECPICKGNNFTTSWQGRLNVIDPDKSEIAKKVNITRKGEYAVKCR